MFEFPRVVLTRLLPLVFLAGVSTCSVIYCAPQDENAKRKTQDENANRHPNATRNRNRNRRPSPPASNSPKAKAANLVIRVSPTDSLVLLDNQQLDTSGQNQGTLSLPGLMPIEHTITVRHPGYGDQQVKITLKPGENDPIAITLDPLKGTLSVKPSVDGASIDVRSTDRNRSVGSYSGAVDNVDLPPGEYELTASKPGYQATTRAFTIKPGGLVALEPRLDPLPTPTPPPRTGIPSVSTVNVEGKYIVVRILGTSGDTSRKTGTIKVTVNRGAPSAYVQGSLSGLPCEASFVALENVAEWSLVDGPSPSNNWALIVARVRPKDSKRPISFNINWSSIQPSTDSPIVVPTQTAAFSRAVIVYQAQPEYPQMARSSRTSGVVTVSVLIDEQGNVKSAKAVDGPGMLRQAAENAARKCRFRPATRNGTATQSTETIAFVFKIN
jgi:TonB family protein